MKIRLLTEDDLPVLKEINTRCHPKDNFPPLKNFIGKFLVITNDEGQIITAGGIELIAEGIAITDNGFSPHVRATALEELLKSMLFTCSRTDQDILHICVTEYPVGCWTRAVQSKGFKPLNGAMFFLEV